MKKAEEARNAAGEIGESSRKRGRSAVNDTMHLSYLGATSS